ncbi:MAG: hypothetical protein H0U39_05620, partial [Segetibacter sp.]|nr:hypothetical protein [Segetibacter sp.]MBA2761431.1 hypothetical protein [Segetibacter sp.]
AATLGQTFTFDVVTGATGAGAEFLPDTTRSFTVQAGPAATGDVAQNGFCVFVTGPFSGTGTTGTGGFFNQGTNVTVTERAQTGFQLVSVTSPTAGTTTAGTVTTSNLVVSGNSGTLTGTNGFIGGTNEIVFTNAATTVATPTPAPTATPGTGGPGTTPTPTATPGVITPTPSPGPTVVPPLRPRKKTNSRLMSSF